MRKEVVVAILVVCTLAIGGKRAEASAPQQPVPPYLATSYVTVELSKFVVTSTTCGQIVTASGQRLGRCVHGDGVPRQRVPLDQRVKSVFRGTATLTVGPNTESVSIRFGRQPAAKYTNPTTVEWPIPGSGTYSIYVTIKSHDESTSSETTSLVPLWVPRRP